MESHPALTRVVTALSILILAGSYLVWADYTGHWPYHPASSEVQYRNAQYGMTVDLPETWRGFTVVTDSYQITEIMSETRIIGTGVTLRIRHPLWRASAPREDLPIMIIPTALWTRIQNEEVAVSAAPIPPTELAHNSAYVFALPPRYNYDYQTGWEEVQQIVDSNPVRAFEPTPTVSCIPRPACLDATPRCLPPEPINGWCK